MFQRIIQSVVTNLVKRATPETLERVTQSVASRETAIAAGGATRATGATAGTAAAGDTAGAAATDVTAKVGLLASARNWAADTWLGKKAAEYPKIAKFLGWSAAGYGAYKGLDYFGGMPSAFQRKANETAQGQETAINQAMKGRQQSDARDVQIATLKMRQGAGEALTNGELAILKAAEDARAPLPANEVVHNNRTGDGLRIVDRRDATGRSYKALEVSSPNAIDVRDLKVKDLTTGATAPLVPDEVSGDKKTVVFTDLSKLRINGRTADQVVVKTPAGTGPLALDKRVREPLGITQ